MNDEQAAAVMPHAIRLTVAVAHGDQDAAAAHYRRAVLAGAAACPEEDAGGVAALLIFVLADLVCSAEAVAVREEVAHHPNVVATIDALSDRGILP